VPSWIIQDGTLPDLRVGDRMRTAVELRLASVPEDPRGECHGSYLSRVGENVHRVCGPRVAVGEVVVDAGGLRLIASGPLAAAAGAVVCGLGWLEATRVVTDESCGVPVEAEWIVREILLQTAPLVPAGGALRARDRSRWGWTPRPATSAWADDGGDALYLVGALPAG